LLELSTAKYIYGEQNFLCKYVHKIAHFFTKVCKHLFILQDMQTIESENTYGEDILEEIDVNGNTKIR